MPNAVLGSVNTVVLFLPCVMCVCVCALVFSIVSLKAESLYHSKTKVLLFNILY